MEDAERRNPFSSTTQPQSKVQESNAGMNVSSTIPSGARTWVTFTDDANGGVITSDCGATSFRNSATTTPLPQPPGLPLARKAPNALMIAPSPAARETSSSTPVGMTRVHTGVCGHQAEYFDGRYHTLSPVAKKEGDWDKFDTLPSTLLNIEEQNGHVRHVSHPEMKATWRVLCKLRHARKKDPWVPVSVSVEGSSVILLKCSEEDIYGIEPGDPGQLVDVSLREELPYHEMQLHHGMQFTEITVRKTDKHWKSHFVKLRFCEFKEKRKMLSIFQRSRKKKFITMLKLCSDDPHTLQSCVDGINEAVRQLPVTIVSGPLTTYHTNEVYIDVEENCEVESKWDGNAIEQKATDKVYITAFISQSPECRLVLNDRMADQVQSTSGLLPLGRAISLHNVISHQCVDKDAFDMNRSIRFYPLDGVKFQLLQCETMPVYQTPLKAFVSYCLDNALVTMTTVLEHSEMFPSGLCLTNVVVKFPVPGMWAPLFIRPSRRGSRSVKSTKLLGIRRSIGSDICQIQTSSGKAKYEAEFGAVVWRIEKVTVEDKPSFQCQFQLLPDLYRPDMSSVQIEVDFDAPGFSCSDIRVRAFRIVNSSTQGCQYPKPKKYVKYWTHYHYSCKRH